MPMSPTPMTVTVSAVRSPPPSPFEGPDGDEHAVATASERSNRYRIGPLPSFTIRGTVSPPLHNDSGVPQTGQGQSDGSLAAGAIDDGRSRRGARRSEEHTSELQSRLHLVCR